MKSTIKNTKHFARCPAIVKWFGVFIFIAALSAVPQDVRAEFTFVAATPAAAQSVVEDGENGTGEPATREAAEAPSEDKDEFSYQLENRKDPFSPFLSAEQPTSIAEPDEIVDAAGQLTGMQLFEPGQLNLVALLHAGTDSYAMVEDVTGKGYIITEGTKIGRRGVVKEIIPNKVLIEETAQTRSGKKIVTQIVMALKKEGDE